MRKRSARSGGVIDLREMIRVARVPLAALSVCVLLAACGAASPPSGQTSSTPEPATQLRTTTGLLTTTVPAGDRKAAQTDAAKLVTQLQLPSGSTPRACTGKLQVLEGNAADALAERCLTVPGSESAVDAYVKQHPPADSKILATGRGGNSLNVLFTLPGVGTTLLDRLVGVDITPGADGNVRVDVEAQSNWVVPRPAAETIPSGVQEVKVIAGKRELTVSGQTKVAGAVKLFDSLLTVQPVTMNCPAFVPKHQLIVQFIGSGSVLAEAKVPAGVVATECYPIKFSVRGKPMKGLIGSNVAHRLQQVLREKLP